MNKLYFILGLVIFLFSCEKKESEYDFSKNNILEDYNYKKLSKTKKEKYLDSIFKNISTKNDSIKINLLFNIASEYYFLDLNKKYLKVSRDILKLAIQKKDSFSIGRAYYYIGDAYEFKKNDSAYFYYKESENIYRKTKDLGRLAKVYYNKAHLLYYESNFIESEKQVSKALVCLINSNNYELLYMCHALQFGNLLELEDYENAYSYYKKAKIYLDKQKQKNANYSNFENYSTLLANDLATWYVKQKKYNEAVYTLNKIVNENLRKKNPYLYAVLLNNHSTNKMKANILKDVEKEKHYSLKYFTDNNLEKNNVYVFSDLADYYLIKKDTAKAVNFLYQTQKLAYKYEIGQEILKSLNTLSKIDIKNKDYYKDKYLQTNDSISKKQRISKETFSRIEYETSKVENENKVLTKKNLFLLISSIGIGFILLSIIFYKQIKAQKREFILLEEKKKAEKEIYQLFQDQQIEMLRMREREQNRIAKELHDGVMNQIYGVRLNLGMLNGFDEEEIKEKRLYYIEMLQKIEGEIREISHDLHGENKFEEIDFKSILEELTHSQNNLSRTIFESEIDPTISWDAISSIIKINIYRIAQELFQNTLKYANAAKCTFKITQSENELLIEVKDDGVGFNSDEAKNGIGYKNIRERIGTINGTIKLNSEINKGTEVTIKVLI
ncbi:Probable two-component system sensor histidine kinase [Flavobacterium indicum GPTSA100-9 = DSM 17447]|uniref:histidine kinase n=1 Tax=Flavobacterium indicum (strain DSM 17447 / CIP 109464 / GPTSA100-9) TaxID=1094466 RepID=H8XPT6_FLAIG|nr:ATP-binding protein [Flavobacterium indicum]CCG54152.1 Probable two-component system sensor histidine kinase [Flavobacterium indicum GPTSA100-9 = DSM 17447]